MFQPARSASRPYLKRVFGLLSIMVLSALLLIQLTSPVPKHALATGQSVVALTKASHGVRATVAVQEPLAVRLIQEDFPKNAWPEAEKVAMCESRYDVTDFATDSNGTHDRGIFQLNDGGTEQELLSMTGHPVTDLNLALNPVWNVRAADLLYHRDGWGRWSCA
jgi:hypothetical protein